MDKGRLKLSFEIKLIGSSTVQIVPVTIDNNIWSYPNAVLYMCKNGYVFEKSANGIKYSVYRLIIPPFIDNKQAKSFYTYTFTDDETRYEFVKKLKYDLIEFSKSGFFGYNPDAHVLTYLNFWFVY